MIRSFPRRFGLEVYGAHYMWFRGDSIRLYMGLWPGIIHPSAIGYYNYGPLYLINKFICVYVKFRLLKSWWKI
jgi:hypothetical protein